MARTDPQAMRPSPPPARSRFQGVAGVIRYNWPYYAGAAVTVAVGLALPRLVLVPVPVAGLVWFGVALTAFWSLASIAVTFYVYDLSALYRWGWLADCLGSRPTRWVNFHAGLDETTDAIRALYPDCPGSAIDIYDPERMTERSIERARTRSADFVKAADIRALPFADSEVEAAFVIFAAHELRDPADRVRFFREVERILRPDGRLVLVEHLRDFWNIAAYGPGAGHFFARAEWIRVASEARLSLKSERPITPFVRCFVFRKAAVG